MEFSTAGDRADAHDPYRRLPSILFGLMRLETFEEVQAGIESSLHLLLSFDVLRFATVDRDELWRAILRPQPGPRRRPTEAQLEALVALRSPDVRVADRGEQVVVAFVAHGVLIGALQVNRLGGPPFTPEERGALLDFGELAGLALHGALVRSELHRLAYADPLTGLANRRRLIEEMERRLEAREPLALVFLDLDGLKPVNDQLGYESGDLLLRAVARALERAVAEDELAARLGGDEFVALLAVADQARATARARSISRTLGSLPLPPEIAARFSGASVAAVAARPGDDVDSLLRRGGRQMHKRKRARKRAR